MKGQYLTVEYLIFFMIGVFMIISVYFSFSNFNNIYRESILQNQLKMTGELISGTIINLYEVSNSTNSSISYNLTIPTEISKCIYGINVVNDKLKVYCTNVVSNNIASTTSSQLEIELTLYNFNISNKNIIYSSNGLLKLFAKDGRVELS
jgi:hypothetical protein